MTVVRPRRRLAAVDLQPRTRDTRTAAWGKPRRSGQPQLRATRSGPSCRICVLAKSRPVLDCRPATPPARGARPAAADARHPNRGVGETQALRSAAAARNSVRTELQDFRYSRKAGLFLTVVRPRRRLAAVDRQPRTRDTRTAAWGKPRRSGQPQLRATRSGPSCRIWYSRKAGLFLTVVRPRRWLAAVDRQPRTRDTRTASWEPGAQVSRSCAQLGPDRVAGWSSRKAGLFLTVVRPRRQLAALDRQPRTRDTRTAAWGSPGAQVRQADRV